MTSLPISEVKNMLNNVNLQGKVANFGKVYREAEGEKQAFCVVFLNVIISSKKNPETGYYDSMPVKCMAWGYGADRLNAFEPGEEVYLSGSLTKENDWTNNDGELVKGQMMVSVQSVHNFAANYSAGEAPSAKPAASKPSKPAATKPGKPAPKRPAVNR